MLRSVVDCRSVSPLPLSSESVVDAAVQAPVDVRVVDGSKVVGVVSSTADAVVVVTSKSAVTVVDCRLPSPLPEAASDVEGGVVVLAVTTYASVVVAVVTTEIGAAVVVLGAAESDSDVVGGRVEVCWSD